MKRFLVYTLILFGIVLAALTITYASMNRSINNFKTECEKSTAAIDPGFNDIPKYYINVDSSTDRREYMEEQIKFLDVKNIERFSAIDPRKLEERNIRVPTGGILDVLTMACMMSHVHVIKQMYDDGHQVAMVLEDDVNFHVIKKWKYTLKQILDAAPKDYEIINLAPHECKAASDIIFVNAKEHEGAVCYIINRSGMKRIVDAFFQDNNLRKEYKNEEDYVSDRYLYKYLNSYMLRPNLFLLNDSEMLSDIYSGQLSDHLRFKYINWKIINTHYS